MIKCEYCIKNNIFLEGFYSLLRYVSLRCLHHIELVMGLNYKDHFLNPAHTANLASHLTFQ